MKNGIRIKKPIFLNEYELINDSIKRQKYYCSLCKGNHFIDSPLGIKHRNYITKTKKNLKNFHEHERMNKQANKIYDWTKSKNFDFEIKFKGTDLRINIMKGNEKASIRLFPIGSSVDTELYKNKQSNITTKVYRDYSLNIAQSIIEKHLNVEERKLDHLISGTEQSIKTLQRLYNENTDPESLKDLSKTLKEAKNELEILKIKKNIEDLKKQKIEIERKQDKLINLQKKYNTALHPTVYVQKNRNYMAKIQNIRWKIEEEEDILKKHI